MRNQLFEIEGNEDDSLLQEPAKPANSPTGSSKLQGGKAWILPMLTCFFYSFASCSMILINKAISYEFDESVRRKLPFVGIVFYQCVVSLLLVEIFRIFGVIEQYSFDISVAKSWLPLNLLFIGMLFSGFMALSFLSVPMNTVLKNITNFITVIGDYTIFGVR